MLIIKQSVRPLYSSSAGTGCSVCNLKHGHTVLNPELAEASVIYMSQTIGNSHFDVND
jgi:hypothetical protein